MGEMAFILLIVFLTTDGRLARVDHLLFDDAATCEAAKSSLEPIAGNRVTMKCVPAHNSSHKA